MFLRLEPWAIEYKIPPATDFEIIVDDNEEYEFSLEFYANSFISIWVPAGTSVYSGGKIFQPYVDL
jgi:hypothetical protein